MTTDLSEISLRVAGEVGAASLSLSSGVPGMLAAVDQHMAEVRDALADTDGSGRDDDDRPGVRVLLEYARGFTEAVIGCGWSPPTGAGTDWESIRLAAICQLMTETLADR